MTGLHELKHHWHPTSVVKRAIQGAAIVLLLVLLFIFLAGVKALEYDPWIFLPIITVSVGGFSGGILFYLMDRLRYQGGWKKVLAKIFSLLIYCVTLWLSLLAALHGTGQQD